MQELIDVAVWHHDELVRETIENAIRSLGHRVEATGNLSQALIAEVSKNPNIQLIVTGIVLEDGDAIEALLEIATHRTIPAIIVTDQDSINNVERALDDHVMAYLLEPVTVPELKATIHLVSNRFREFTQLADQVKCLEQQIKMTQDINRAKMTLMEKHKIGEQSAHDLLRRMAMNGRKRMAEVAAQIISASNPSPLQPGS